MGVISEAQIAFSAYGSNMFFLGFGYTKSEFYGYIFAQFSQSTLKSYNPNYLSSDYTL